MQTAWQANVTPPAGVTLQYFDTIDSTNSWYLHRGQTNTVTAVLAAQQTHGRGRRERTWVSEAHENLYLTLGFEYRGGLEDLRTLALQTSITLLHTLRALDFPLQIKWPNDLYLNNGKVGGVLVESRVRQTHTRVAVGIGLNFTPPPIATHDRVTAGLSAVRPLDACQCASISSALINAIYSELILPLTRGEALPPLAWPHEADLLAGQEINVITNQINLSGMYKGINADGLLQLSTPTDTMTFPVEQVERVHLIAP